MSRITSKACRRGSFSLIDGASSSLATGISSSCAMLIKSPVLGPVPYVLFIRLVLALVRRRYRWAHVGGDDVAGADGFRWWCPAFLENIGMTGNALKTAWPDYTRLTLSIGYGYVGIALGLLLIGRRLDDRDPEVA